MQKKSKNILILFILVILLSISVFVIKQNDEEVIEEKEIEILAPKPKFPIVSIQAKSAVVKDINSGEVLYSKNENDVLPLASITKIMTIYTLDTLVENNEFVPISLNAINTYGEYGFSIGEVWPKKSLEAFTLITSSNDGAVALAEFGGSKIISDYDPNNRVNSFVNYMNKLSSEMKLYNTSFKNPSGLDDDAGNPGAFGTALDTASMFEYILKNSPSSLESTIEVVDTFFVNNKTYKADNTNQIVGTIPTLIASKTGFTDTAGGNLAVVYDNGINNPIVIVVLGSTKEGRFTDMSILIDSTRKYFEMVNNHNSKVKNQ